MFFYSLLLTRVQTHGEAAVKHSHRSQLHAGPFFHRMCLRARVRARASFPVAALCAGVCQRCCLQAGLHCVQPLLLIDTGPPALRVPMAPQPQRTEGWNRSPGPGESLFALPPRLPLGAGWQHGNVLGVVHVCLQAQFVMVLAAGEPRCHPLCWFVCKHVIDL